MRLRALVVTLALAAAACSEDPAAEVSPAPTAAPTPSTAPAAPETTATAPRDRRPPPGSLPEPVPPSEDHATTGEVPGDLLDSVLADLTARTGIPAEQITVAGGEAVVWPDGSLGCPVPGEAYTQAEVPGYRILLEAGEGTFDYRAAKTGWFRLCP